MNDKITLSQDASGNYRVDIVGLLYLMQSERLSENSVVFCLNTKKDYVLNQPLFGSAFLEDDKGKPLTLTTETMNSEYIIVMDTFDEEEEEESYEPIHFEEALMRMSKGEIVYLDRGDGKGKVDREVELDAREIVSGDWYTTEETKGVKVSRPDLVPEKRNIKEFNPWNFFDEQEENLDEDEELMELLSHILSYFGFEVLFEDEPEEDWEEYY